METHRLEGGGGHRSAGEGRGGLGVKGGVPDFMCTSTTAHEAGVEMGEGMRGWDLMALTWVSHFGLV